MDRGRKSKAGLTSRQQCFVLFLYWYVLCETYVNTVSSPKHHGVSNHRISAVCWTVCSGAQQWKQLDSHHKRPVMQKNFHLMTSSWHLWVMCMAIITLRPKQNRRFFAYDIQINLREIFYFDSNFTEIGSQELHWQFVSIDHDWRRTGAMSFCRPGQLTYWHCFR